MSPERPRFPTWPLWLAFCTGSCHREPVHDTPGVQRDAPPPANTRVQPIAIAIVPDVAAPSIDASEERAVLAAEKIRDDEPRLYLGRAAPKLRVDEWLKGSPIAVAPGKIYVIENWATWCPPCIAQMPQLSHLAQRYADRDVEVIAVNVEGLNSKDPGETELDRVRQFVAKHSVSMQYRVAFANPQRMQRDWLDPAGLEGIPASFVIDRRGRIAWIGHPQQLDEVVRQIVAGDWDVAAARSRATRARLAVLYSARAAQLLKEAPQRAYRLIRVLLGDVLRDQPEYLNGLAYHIFAAPDVAERNLDVAYLAGSLGCQAQGWSDATAIETLSKIREQQGQLDLAISLQSRAAATESATQRHRSRFEALTARVEIHNASN